MTNSQQQAEQLAMKAAEELTNPHTSAKYQANVILSTIPLVELLESNVSLIRALNMAQSILNDPTFESKQQGGYELLVATQKQIEVARKDLANLTIKLNQ